jgi:Zn-dependent protease with chaperone function
VHQKANRLQAIVNLFGKMTNFFAHLSHSRCHEHEADKYGIKIAALADFKPEGAVWLQHKFLEIKDDSPLKNKEKGWFFRFMNRGAHLFSTHPPSIDRLNANSKTVEILRKEGVEAIFPKR